MNNNYACKSNRKSLSLLTKETVSLSTSKWHLHMEWKSFSHVRLFANPWLVAHQAPLSREFSRQEYWSGYLERGSFQPRDWSQVSHIAGGVFIIWTPREAQSYKRSTQPIWCRIPKNICWLYSSCWQWEKEGRKERESEKCLLLSVSCKDEMSVSHYMSSLWDGINGLSWNKWFTYWIHQVQIRMQILKYGFED